MLDSVNSRFHFHCPDAAFEFLYPGTLPVDPSQPPAIPWIAGDHKPGTTEIRLEQRGARHAAYDSQPVGLRTRLVPVNPQRFADPRIAEYLDAASGCKDLHLGGIR